MCKANNLVWQKHRIYEENHDKTAVRAYSPQYLSTYGDKMIYTDNYQYDGRWVGKGRAARIYETSDPITV